MSEQPTWKPWRIGEYDKATDTDEDRAVLRRVLERLMRAGVAVRAEGTEDEGNER